ncbi:MAG: peptide deformylase [Betaproteobacteria bacterium]|nr:peptide deformylase [Betaproteobacteria bacterium]
MALLDILEWPDPRLATVAQRVQMVDANVKQLVADMAQTMYAAPGIGLAASQVDVHLRVIVIDISETHDALNVFINPEITASEGEAQHEEGCLSVPGIYDQVTRAARITVRAQNAQGETIEMQAEGLMAVCIQHEMDHLKGIVFIEHLSRLKRDRIARKLKKRQRVSA